MQLLTTELKDTLTFILAGGRGSRLAPLTLPRAKPAVPFGGSYRIIDFTLSNCIHSGLRRIYVLSQYHARSLDEHIRFGWNFLPRRLEQFISVRPPHHKREEKWYAGTADAIAQNLDAFQDDPCSHALILSGDHVYKMDYSIMLREHLERGSAATLAAIRIPKSEASEFGILETDAQDRITAFQEKPKSNPATIPGDPDHCLASMGVYLFETDELVARLREDRELGDASSHDFGKDVLPRMIGDVPVHAHRFTDVGGNPDKPYWRDVGTIDAYFEANMDLCAVAPQFNLYGSDWPVYTLWHNDPPAKTIWSGSHQANVQDSLLCPGTVVAGGTVKRSILSNRVVVHEGALVEDSLLFSGVEVGPGAVVRRAIIDKWVKVPAGALVGNDSVPTNAVKTSSSIVVVPRDARLGK